MYTMRRFLYLLSVVAAAGACVVLFSAGCVKPPDQQLAAAKAAFKAAQDAEAGKYMANNFSNLKKAMEAAEEEVAVQMGKSGLSQNYSKAKVLLSGVIDLGNKIAAETPQAKVEMKKEIEQGLAASQEKAKEIRKDIKRAPKAKGKKTLAEMASDLDKADKALFQAQAALAAGNIIDAGGKLSDAQGLLKKINDKLSTDGLDGLM
jgi:hypothetical protein